MVLVTQRAILAPSLSFAPWNMVGAAKADAAASHRARDDMEERRKGKSPYCIAKVIPARRNQS